MSQQINLFNPIFLAQKKYFSAVAMMQALALVLVGMLLLDAFAVRQADMLQRLHADTVREAAERRTQLATIGKQFSDRGTSKKLEEDIARVTDQLRKRGELFAELKTTVGGNMRGFSPFLTALARRTMRGVWLTAVDAGGDSGDLVIKGRALNADLVPAYVRALSDDPVFAGRSLSSLQVTARAEGPRAPAIAQGAPAQRYLEFTLNFPLAGASRGASATARGAQ